MTSNKKDLHLKNLIAYSFVLSVVIGFSGGFFPEGGIQHLMWALGSFFMIIGSSLLGSKLSRNDHDIPAAGFAVITVAQALAYGFLATNDAGTEQFGAVIAVFVPGLVLISFYDLAPLFIRICGFISAAGFATLALLIFIHTDLSLALREILTGIGYAGLNFSLLGWAWLVYRKKI